MHPDGENKPRRRAVALVVCLGAILLTSATMALSTYDLLPEAPDKITYNWRTALFSTQAKAQRDDIAIILVNDDSLLRYWSRSPVDRAMIAELIGAIDSASPKAIGLDFIVDRPADPQKTKVLIQAIRNARAPIVLGAIDSRAKRVKSKSYVSQEEFITRAGRPAGHLFFASERRRFRLDEDVVRFRGQRSLGPERRESFAKVLALQVLGSKVPEPASPHIAWLRAPKQSSTPLFSILNIPEHDPVDGTGDGQTVLPKSWRGILKDKIVLIGGDFVDQDQHQTPLSIVDGKRVPGVTIHAHILAQLLDQRSVHTVSRPLEALAVLLIAAFGFYLGHRIRSRSFDTIVSIVGVVALVAIGMWAFSRWQLIIPSTTFSFAWVGGVTFGHFSTTLGKKVGFNI